MHNIKLIVADIDGTLVNEERVMLPKNREMLNKLHAQGIKVGIASGRPLGKNLYHLNEEWGLDFEVDLWIGMNGGQIYDKSDDSYMTLYKLQPSDIKEIITFMEPIKANPFIYIGEDMLSKEVDEEMYASMARHHINCTKVPLERLWRDETEKILFRLKDKNDMPKAEEFARKHNTGDYVFFKTQPTMLEFQDKRVNKGLAVQKYIDKHHITNEEVMAFGDMSNDNEMLKMAGVSVCLKQGSQDTKDVAKFITELDNDHDGMGYFLEKYFGE